MSFLAPIILNNLRSKKCEKIIYHKWCGYLPLENEQQLYKKILNT